MLLLCLPIGHNNNMAIFPNHKQLNCSICPKPNRHVLEAFLLVKLTNHDIGRKVSTNHNINTNPHSIFNSNAFRNTKKDIILYLYYPVDVFFKNLLTLTLDLTLTPARCPRLG